MGDREAQFEALRRARLAVPADQFAAESAAKRAEIAYVDAKVEAGRRRNGLDGDTHTYAAGQSTGSGRVALAVRGVGRQFKRLGRLVALVGPAIRYSGGTRAAMRKAVGRIRREGLSGIRSGVEVADLSREPTPEQLAAVLQRRLTLSPPWYSADDAEVSLIVVNSNRTGRTIDCIRSLWEHTAGRRYEIVVVDNGSRPEEFAQFSQLEGPCRLLRLPVHRHGGEGNNLGAEAAMGRFLVLMGHDVTVTQDWLEPLMDLMTTTSDCGAVGPKALFPSGLVSEAGGLLDESGRIVLRGTFQDHDDPDFNTTKAVDYVSPACTLLRKEDFERILGFDMTYGSGYEHADLCLRLSQLGLRVYYAPTSIVVRQDSATTSGAGDSTLARLTEVNRAKFLDRWGAYLRTGRHTPPPEPRPLPTCAPGDGKPSAAVYTAHPLNPGGGERYLLGLVAQLQRLGFHVRLVTPAPYSLMRVTALANVFGIELDGLCLNPLDEARALAPFDEFVAMGNDLVPPIEPLGSFNTYLCQFPFPTPDEEMRRRAGWYAAYDRIVVYSAFAEGAMAARARGAGLPERPIEIIAPAVPLSTGPIATEKSGIVSVGRFFVGGHSKRQDLQIRAFRKLVESGAADGTVLHLVGASSAEPENRKYVLDCIAAAEGLPVRFHIDAGADVLESLYNSCSLFWHSAGLGVDVAREPERCEHFGISPIEAMSYGTIPFVVDNGGPAAIITDGVDGFHYHDLGELVERTARLLAMSEVERLPLRAAARSRACDYSNDAFAARVGEVFSR